MNVCRSTYYAWRKPPTKVITSAELYLYRRLKTLFKACGHSLGSRELSRKLREESFFIDRYRTRTLMRWLNLKVRQRIVYKVTTKCKHSDAVADDLLNQNFKPVDRNEVWSGDITYRAHG